VSSACDVAIVGGGAAGLATAIFTGRRRPGARLVVLDGARRLGAKILVSGGGRCNVTNRVVRASDYWGGDRRVIDGVLRAFPAAEAVRFFEELGVPLHEEADGKLFPDTNRSRTVLDALLGEASRLGVRVETGWRVGRIERRPGGGFLLEGPNGSCAAPAVVLATGGLSVPKSGSDGGGLALARSLGHAVVDTTPALAPLRLSGDFHGGLAGVAHEASLSLAVEGSRTLRLRGALLWTHFGISGPVALDASRHWHRAGIERRPVVVRLSFLPDDDFGRAEARLLSAAAARPSAAVRTVVAEWMPAAVAGALLEHAQVDPATRMAHLGRDDRRRLTHDLTAFVLPIVGSRGYNDAEATAGGVPLDEVERGTMASRMCPGLFLAGEMLDVDGRLGGFNFQWAWSSAWVAARGVAVALGKAECRMQNAECGMQNAEMRNEHAECGLRTWTTSVRSTRR
jgi:predicted Rossmann fold flavoprotein